MPSSQGSAAYDTLYYKRSYQEEEQQSGAAKAPVVTHQSSKTLRLRRVNKTASLPMSNKAFHSFNADQIKLIVVSGVSLVALAAFFVASIGYQARKNELATTIASREADLKKLEDDYQGLMVDYDTKMSDSAIQEYAEEKLGMQKRENFQLEWISVGEENDFENDDTQKHGFLEWIKSYFG